MRNVKCSDCDEYRNEWCEKVIDSPHPDMIRDCQYWHERKDLVEVVRCKDCKYYKSVLAHCTIRGDKAFLIRGADDFCSRAERREG